MIALSDFISLPGKALLFSVSLCLATSAYPDTPENLEAVKERIAQTSQQLQSLSAEIEATRTLKKELQRALEKSESSVGERDQRLSELQDKIATFDQQLTRLSSRVQKAESDVEFTKAQLTQALRAVQMMGGRTMLKILLQHEDPAKAQRMQIYSSYLFAAQQDLMRFQVDFLQKLKAAEQKLLKDRNWLNHILNKASGQRDAYALAAAQSRSQLTNVDQTLAQKTQSVAQLNSDQERLQSLMEELQLPASARSGYFESQKGQYTLPVSGGDIIARFGDLKTVGKLRWNGLYIRSAPGRAVQAMADGEVLYSDWLQGFGMLVILDHGDGYMSLYGGNREVTVQQGDWVESGSTIATVGDSGGQKGSGLYFEIRHNATALDPKDWLQIDQS